MKKNSTYLAILLDNSGSMLSIRDYVINGFNDFIKEQKAELLKSRVIEKKEEGEIIDGGQTGKYFAENEEQIGEVYISVATFDSDYSEKMRFNFLYENVPLDKVGELKKFNPDGGTPLNDATSSIISHIEKVTGETKPEKIICVIISDGGENSSQEFPDKDRYSYHYKGKAKIKELVIEKEKIQEDKPIWKFIYLGANQDAAQEATTRGVNSSLNYTASSKGTESMFYAASKGVGKALKAKMRRSSAGGQGLGVDDAFETMNFSNNLNENYTKAFMSTNLDALKQEDLNIIKSSIDSIKAEDKQAEEKKDDVEAK